MIALFIGGMVVLSGIGVAQEGEPAGNQPTTTANASGPNYTHNPTLVGDENVYLVDYWKANGTMYIQLYAESATLVTVSSPPDSNGEVAGGYIRQEGVKSGRLKTISIQSPGDTVWISSVDSVRNGRFTRLKVGGSSLISGPYDGDDVFHASAGAAVFTGFVVLYDAVKAKRGLGQNAERVA